MRYVALAARIATGCGLQDSGPFEVGEGGDDTLEDGIDGKADGASCRAQRIAHYALGGTVARDQISTITPLFDCGAALA